LFSPIFIEFVFISIVFQASFILLFVNLAALVLPVVFVKFRKYLASELSSKIIAQIVAVEMLIYLLILFLQYCYGNWMIEFFSDHKIVSAHQLHSPLYLEFLQEKGTESLRFAIPSILFCALSYFLKGNKSSVRDLLFFLMAISAGVYLAEAISFYPLSYHLRLPELWAVYLMVPLGTFSLLQSKKGWIVWVLVLHQFIGETGIFFAQEILGIQFVSIRTMPLRFPLYIIIVIEAVLFAINTVSMVLPKVNEFFPFKFNRKIDSVLSRPRVESLFMCGTLVFVFWGMQSNLFHYFEERGMPSRTPLEKFSIITSAIQDHNIDDRFVHKPPFSEAHKNLQAMKLKHKDSNNPFERIYVGSDEVGEKLNKPLFFPSSFQRLNTFFHYSASDMPSNFVSMYLRGGDITPRHYENSQEGPLVLRIFKFLENFHAKVHTDGSYDFAVIRPHSSLHSEDTRRFNREVLAEAGSGVPRAFVVQKVTKLNGQQGEFRHIMDNIMASGKSITTEITTSDEGFEHAFPLEEAGLIHSNIEFKQDMPEHIILKTVSDGNGYLALLDTHSAGWRALIDGKEVPIYRGYIGTRFVPLAQGKHTVEFLYALPGFAIAKIISILAWAIMGLLAMYLIFRKPLFSTDSTGRNM